jgi:hypothetical protein
VNGLVGVLALALSQRPLHSPPPIPPIPPWGEEAVALGLRGLNEPPLPPGEQRLRVLRLVMVPSFPSRRIAVIRATVVPNGGVEVVTKSLTDWFPGTGVAKTFPTVRLSSARWKQVADLLEAGLWRFRPAPFPDLSLHDGTAWYLETSGPRGYVSIIQHSPRAGSFRDLCSALLLSSSLDLTQQEFTSWIAAP